MANELTINLLAEIINVNLKHTINPGTIQVDQTTIGARAPVVTVNSSAEEDLTVGDIGTLGYLFMRNLDPTNYVTWGPKDTTMKAVGRMEAGEMAMLRLEPGITLRWQANTAAVKVQVWLFED